MKNKKKTKIDEKVLVLSHVVERNKLKAQAPYSFDGTIKFLTERGVKINFRG